MTGDTTDGRRTWGESGWGWNAREPYAAPRYLTDQPAARRPEGVRTGLLRRLRSLLAIRHR